MLKGMHTSNTANILTKPINRYITVVNCPPEIPSTGDKNVKNIIFNIITIAKGMAFRITVVKNLPLTGLLFGSNDMKNEVYASIAKSINVICIGINGKLVLVNIQKIESSIEYIVFIKKILATLVRLFTTLLPSINTSLSTLKS